MKANWKIALMCVATIAFVACKGGNDPKDPGKDPDKPEEYKNPISVTDASLADWDALDKAYVFEATCPADGNYLALKKMKVYADQYYINVQAEFDPEEIIDRSWTPFHFYFNTDNSDATGGYGDQWNDANIDILMEGAVFALADENDPASAGPCAYVPDVFAWAGEVGGTGWTWEGLTASAAFVTSQHVGNVIEFQFIRELVPTPQGAAWNADEFGMGVDIQQSWESVGILPLVSPTDENPTGHTNKLQVKIKK